MFDVSMVELAVIALVALLVLGPEKLPRAARTIGLYVRKAKQSWYSVRGEIERELAADELKRSLKRTEESVRAMTRLEFDPLAPPAATTPSAAATPAPREPSSDSAAPATTPAAASDARRGDPDPS